MTIDVYGIAAGLTQAVNPFIQATLRRSTGPVVADDYSTTSGYEEIPVEIEVQALSGSDLQHIENINQQADMRAVYMRGAPNALNRPLQVGGDVLVFDGSDWLITQVLEEWGAEEWRKVLVTRQIPATPSND